MDGITKIVDAKIDSEITNYSALKEATIIENYDRANGNYKVSYNGARLQINGAADHTYNLQDAVYISKIDESWTIVGKKVTSDTAPLKAADPFADFVRFARVSMQNINNNIFNWSITPAQKADIITIALDSKIEESQANYQIIFHISTTSGGIYEFKLNEQSFLGSTAFREQMVRYSSIDVSNLGEITNIQVTINGNLIIIPETSFMELANTLGELTSEEVFIYSLDENLTYQTLDGELQEKDRVCSIGLQYTYLVPGTADYKIATQVSQLDPSTKNENCTVNWQRYDEAIESWFPFDGGQENSFQINVAASNLFFTSRDQTKIRALITRTNLETQTIETLYSNILVFQNEKHFSEVFIIDNSMTMEFLDGSLGAYNFWGIDGLLIDSNKALELREVEVNFETNYSYTELFSQISNITWTYPVEYLEDKEKINTGEVIYQPGETDDEATQEKWIKNSLKFSYWLRKDNILKEADNSRQIICTINFTNGKSYDISKNIFFTRQTLIGDSVIVRFKQNGKYYTILSPDKTYDIETLILDSQGQEKAGEITYSRFVLDENEPNGFKWKNISSILEISNELSYQVLKVDIAFNNVENYSYTKYVPIPIGSGFNESDEIIFTGPTEIEYDSSGYNPKFKDEAFGLYVNKEQQNVTWTANILLNSNGVYKDAYPVLKDNKILPAPYYEYNIPWYTFYVRTDNFIQPIIIRQSKYFSSIINSWGGEYKIDDDGRVMTPALIAGTKTTDNKFTGVIAGSFDGIVDDSSNKSIEAGLLGYEAGAQSFGFLSDGTAFIGKTGGGRIEFDGNKGIIKSDGAILNEEGIYTTKGLLIDLDESYTDENNQQIKAGGIHAKNFALMPNGKLIAQDAEIYGKIDVWENSTIAGWQVLQNQLWKEEDKITFYINTGKTGGEEETEGWYTVNGNRPSNQWLLWATDDNTRTVTQVYTSIDGNFGVTQDGKLYAKDVNISGEITATTLIATESGKIGGFNLNATELITDEYQLTGDTEKRKIGLRAPSAKHNLNDAALAIGIPEGSDDESYYWYRAPFYVTFEGAMHATKGQIGGWTLSTNELKQLPGSYILNDGSTQQRGGCGFRVAHKGININTDPLLAIGWGTNVGNGNYWGDAPFCVFADGRLKATKAIIEGNIVATGGSFTNCTIEDSCTIKGTLSGATGNFSGVITAENGEIGGWFIKKGKIYAGDGSSIKTSVMQAPSNDTTWVFAAGGSSHDSYSDCPFRVDKLGNLYSTSAHIEGEVTATSGKIGKWSLDEDGYLKIGEHGGSSHAWVTKDKFRLSSAGVAVQTDITPGFLLLYHNKASIDTSVTLSSTSLEVKNGETTKEVEWSDVIDVCSGNRRSDLRIKNSVEMLNDNYEQFFNLLSPKRYKYNNGTSGRYHTGFIAQEVVAALEKSNLNTADFAAVMLTNPSSENECWHLRRDEFVALNTWQIQRLKKHTNEVESKIQELEQEIEQLKQLLY